MTSRTGTKTEIDARFGFKESGTFRCAYGNEKPLLIVLAVITAVLAVCVFIFSTWILTGKSAMLFWAMLFILSEGVLLFIAATLAKLILYGKECFYHADEQKLSVERGGKFEDLFYLNVLCVRYEPLMTFGRQRGFVVSVTTRKGTAVYKYIFSRIDVVMSPEKTPFAIVEERAGLKVQHETKPVAIEKSAKTAIAEKSEETGGCTVVTEPQSALFGRVADPDQKISRVASEAEELTAKGSFKVPHKRELLMFVVCLCLGIAAVTDCMVDIAAAPQNPEILLIGAFLFVIIDITLYRMLHRTEYKYAADSREFRIYDKIGVREVIYFCDVEKVEYKPYKLLFKQRGYTVSIVMKYKTVTYNYLFLSNRKYQETYETPFNHIERMVSGEYSNSSKLGR